MKPKTKTLIQLLTGLWIIGAALRWNLMNEQPNPIIDSISVLSLIAFLIVTFATDKK